MPRPSRQKEGGYRPPAAVADFIALDAALADYIVEGSVAASAHSAIEGFWRLWERHCEDHKVDPLDAPWAVWQELENLRRDDGRHYNGQLIGAILNAVEHHYRQNGVTGVPAPRRPEHALDWKAVCREWTTVTNEAKGRSTPDGEGSEVELRPVAPMMREDALALLAVPLDAPGWPDHRRASFVQQRAELLVAIETRAPAWQLEGVVLGDIEVRGDGGVAFADFALPCDHRERVRGVPWDCSACAVLDAVAARPGDGPEVSFVLGPDPGASEKRQRADARNRFRSGMVRVRGRWGGLEGPMQGQEERRAVALVPKVGLTAWESAGLRRGLVVVEAGPRSLAWLVGRPWMGVAWAAGFRMSSDLGGLPRSAAQQLITGEPGVLLRLGATKTDQGGLKTVKRPFTFKHQPTITQAFVQYLAVRDAAVGDDPDGPLFLSSDGGLWPARFIAKPRGVCSAHLASLARAAGLEKHFSPMSTRKGYVAQTEADGWALERTQAGMRHVRTETTLEHYRENAAKAAAQKLIDKASGGPS